MHSHLGASMVAAGLVASNLGYGRTTVVSRPLTAGRGQNAIPVRAGRLKMMPAALKENPSLEVRKPGQEYVCFVLQRLFE